MSAKLGKKHYDGLEQGLMRWIVKNYHTDDIKEAIEGVEKNCDHPIQKIKFNLQVMEGREELGDIYDKL